MPIDVYLLYLVTVWVMGKTDRKLTICKLELRCDMTTIILRVKVEILTIC